MKDRFDLEAELGVLYSFADHIGLVCDNILNEDSLVDKDRITNCLIGIQTLLEMQTSKLHDTMCQVLKLDSYKETK